MKQIMHCNITTCHDTIHVSHKTPEQKGIILEENGQQNNVPYNNDIGKFGIGYE